MRQKHPSGLTAIERAILARLKKGPAALSSLAHAARCKSASIKVHICRLRKKLPPGMTIPRSFYGVQTYRLEQDDRKSHSRNNIWYVAESLPDYTLCECTLALLRWVKNLARATLLCSGSISWGP
jgi:hypothetical protein